MRAWKLGRASLVLLFVREVSESSSGMESACWLLVLGILSVVAVVVEREDLENRGWANESGWLFVLAIDFRVVVGFEWGFE